MPPTNHYNPKWRQPRQTVLVAILIIFIAFSVHRFSEYAWSEHQLDLPSEADLIGVPARQYLGAHLEHAAHIGCQSANPQWTDACEYIWYSMLPLYVDAIHSEVEGAAYPYFLFIPNPHSAESGEQQASGLKGYRINMALPEGAFLLERATP